MAKVSIKAGTTSYIAQVFIQDSSSTTGAGLTGLTNATSGLTAYYHRDTDTTATAISLVTMTVGTFTSSGFKEIDSTNMPGWYQLCPPNAAIASGAKSCGIHLKGATNMAPLPLEIELTAWDNQDAVHGGLSCLPNTAVTTNASLLTSGTGTDQISVTSGRIDLGKILGTTSAGAAGSVGIDWAQVSNKTSTVALTNTTVGTVTTVTNQLTAAAIATGVWQDTTAGDFTTASSIGKSLYTSGNAPGAASGLALVGSNMGTVTSVTGAVGSVTGNVGGNVVGSVASVTGAVGSVTGNVGGNVVGSVASVTGAVGSVTGNVGGNVVGSVASVTAAVAITSNIKTNQALNNFEFLMTDSTNHNPSTGLSVTVQRSIDGGAFGGGTLSAVTEIANGIYAVNFGAGDLNGKVIVLKATATGSDTRFERIVTQP